MIFIKYGWDCWESFVLGQCVEECFLLEGFGGVGVVFVIKGGLGG